MAGVNYKALLGHYRADPEAAARTLRESFESGGVRPRDFDFGKLFAECFGWSEYVQCRERSVLANEVMGRRLTEAQGAVTTAAFQNISGQIVYQTVLDGYEGEEFVFTKLIPEAQATILTGEKVAGLTDIGDEVAVRGETEAYKPMGFGEDWVFTPEILDRGGMLALTWEAIFADRTGQILEKGNSVGAAYGLNREKRAIDCVIDENTTRHRYNWRGTVIATYGDNSGTHTWDNLAASNALVDWTDVDVAEQVFNGMANPYTGEPIMVEPRHLVVTKQLEQTARRVLSATEIRVATPGYATAGNPTLTNQNNPYLNKYELVTSRLLASRLATDTDWFLADLTKLAKCMVAEKMRVVPGPSNSQVEFERRIVRQWSVNERCEYVTMQPRAAVKSTA